MFKKFYPAVTLIIILINLLNAVIMPLVGAIGAFFGLVGLTLKCLLFGKIGEKASSLTEKLTPEKETTAGSGSPPKTASPAPPASSPSLAKPSGAPLNIWAMLIDYLTTPMNQAEQIMLIFGWVLLPIAAAIPFVLIMGVAAYVCKGTLPFDWCQFLPIQQLIKIIS